MGSVANLSMMWDLADTMNALMAIPNLISLLLLTRVLVKETNKYLWGNQLDAFDQDMVS
jgi:AGCS family alanine or glycine:cation symporter